MCLITTFRKGFIAPKDITVYKQLRRFGSRWATPCREWEVSLDSMLTPDEDSPEITDYSHRYWIEGGVIHSYSRLEDIEEGSVYFKAIIPEGTKFWVGDDLGEVASERLYLTSEMVVDENLETDFSSLYSSYCLDLLLKDGRRVSWSPEVNPGDVKGMFVYDSQAINLEVYESIFSDTPLPNLPDKILKREEALEDMKGKERTRFLRENYPDIEVLFDLPKDFYIPSYGELSKALENFLLINLTWKALGLNIIGIGYEWFWSSTPYNNDSVWYVAPYYCTWSGLCSYPWKLGGAYVLPFIKKDL